MKFILLCFLIAFTYQQDIDIDKIYDKIVIVFKGMASSDEYKCANTLAKSKGAMVEIINNIIKDLKDGKKITDVLMSYIGKIMAIDGFMENCKVIQLGTKIMSLANEKGLKDLGYNIIEHAADIVNYFKQIVQASTLDDKLLIIGKLISVVIDFQVL